MRVEPVPSLRKLAGKGKSANPFRKTSKPAHQNNIAFPEDKESKTPVSLATKQTTLLGLLPVDVSKGETETNETQTEPQICDIDMPFEDSVAYQEHEECSEEELGFAFALPSRKVRCSLIIF